MLAKLIVEGKEFPIEIQDPRLKELLMPKKKTGYERVERNEEYYYIDCDNDVNASHEGRLCGDKDSYENANYYSDYTIAENNARADKLMRQLRRFAVEHRDNKVDWTNANQRKYFIDYNNSNDELGAAYSVLHNYFGVIYFDTEKAAKLAIETFHDELIWYFTEYKDSL
jgi:hypothetical protein